MDWEHTRLFCPWDSPGKNTGLPFGMDCHFFLQERFSLVIYFIHSVSSVYMSIPISQFLPLCFPSWCPYVGSLHLSISVLQIKSSIPLCRFHIYALIYNVCFWISWHTPWKMVGPEAGQIWSPQRAEKAGFWQSIGPAQAEEGLVPDQGWAAGL